MLTSIWIDLAWIKYTQREPLIHSQQLRALFGSLWKSMPRTEFSSYLFIFFFTTFYSLLIAPIFPSKKLNKKYGLL